MGSRKISVIIPTKNRPQDVVRCLESILNQTLLPDEIIIVDAGDTDELNSKVERYSSEKIKIIHVGPGLTYGRNVGVEASSGDILFFLDDDVVLEKDYVREMVKIFDGDSEKKIAGVCGKEVSPPQKPPARPVLAKVLHGLNEIITTVFLLSMNGDGRFRASGFPYYTHSINEIKRVEFIHGHLAAYRREIFAKFKFDEKLQGTSLCEDDDFSYRVSRHYVNMFTPHAKLIHYYSPVGRNKRQRVKVTLENRYYLFKKNFPQTFKYKFGFWWAVIGLFVMAMIGRDKEVLKGLLDGLINMKNTTKKR